MNTKIFDIIAPIVNDWNKNNYWKVAAVQEEDSITISPIEGGPAAHIPGPVLRDIALLSEVYGFCMSIHSRNNVPYILI